MNENNTNINNENNEKKDINKDKDKSTELSTDNVADINNNNNNNNNADSDMVYGSRTVFIAGEAEEDSSKPLLSEGYDERKAKKLSRKKKKKVKSNYKKQKQWVMGLIAVILVLSISCGFVMAFVSTIVYVDEADGTKYYIRKKDNPDYDPTVEGSYKRLYYMCDSEGYTLDLTPDGYYSTEAGTLVDVDSETGEYEVIAIVDTEGSETLGTQRRIMMFPHTPKADIQTIEVHNSEGGYSFFRDTDDNFKIKGFENTIFDAELFSSLIVSTGYTLTIRKINGPLKDENGEYTEYGLASEIRTDAEGNEYSYEPAWYKLTTTDGEEHTVILGDLLVTGGGYYVQYQGRDAVYVVSPTIGNTVLEPIETLVTPMLIYPMSMNDYFDVESFQLQSFSYDKFHQTNNEDDVETKIHASFSYISIEERENTEQSSYPYVMNEGFMDGYTPSSNTVDACLQRLYQMLPLSCKRLGITDAALEKYDLVEPRYMISFVFNAVDDDTGVITPIPNLFIISDKTENGTYYAASLYFDMIVEVPESDLVYLEYPDIDWVDESFISVNIGFVEDIRVQTSDTDLYFEFDNSQSDLSDGISSDRMNVTIKQDGKSDLQYIWGCEITDTKGFTWKIDSKYIYAYDSTGEQTKISGLYRADNQYGNSVSVVDGWITDARGNSVSVTADTITFRDSSGATVEYGRAALSNFRQFYKTLLYATISGQISDEATEEELEALRNSDDSSCQLLLTINLASGRHLEFRFYKLTERKSYMTINGQGSFFVLRTLVDKIAADANRAVSGEAIDSISKY